jgi:hypothetical protein
LLQLRLESLGILFGSDKAKQLFPNELDFYHAADEFIDVAIKDYPTEKARLEASKPFLLAIFGDGLKLEHEVARIGRSEKQSVKGNASTTKFDGAYVTTIETDKDKPKITRVIFEWKNRVGEGDPLPQMTKGYSEEVYGFKACISFAWLLVSISEVNLAIIGQELLRVDVFSEDLRRSQRTYA